jgi:hypothetical protein
MDARKKRNRAEGVWRRFTRDLAPLGFRRTKASFWTREREFVVEFIHIHLFTFAPAFRVHLGIRVLNDSFGAPALNGLCTSDGWHGTPPQYFFEFADSQLSVERCADNLARFVKEVAITWFGRFMDPQALITVDDSPVREDARQALEEALSGRSIETRVATSKAMLGVALDRRRPRVVSDPTLRRHR